MKTALIVALILLVVGALLVGIGWVFLNPADMNTVKDVVKVYHISEAPQEIDISTTVSRVVLLPIEGEEWRVECMDREDLYHTVELKDGVLTVKQIDNRKWYQHIGILNSLQNLTVTVHLPSKVYESLSIHSTSGSIKVEEGLIFSNATLQNTSGSVSCASRIAGALNLKNTSGSITVSGSVGGSLTAKNTSGSITVNGSVGGDLIVGNTSGGVRVLGGVNGNLDVTNGSGRIEIANATPASVRVKNTSGGIYLENVICKERCTIENTSGGVELQRCDAMSFDVTTVSGGIRASLLSDKVYDCRSTSGSIHTPGDGMGGTFKARSTTGSIRVEIVISSEAS